MYGSVSFGSALNKYHGTDNTEWGFWHYENLAAFSSNHFHLVLSWNVIKFNLSPLLPTPKKITEELAIMSGCFCTRSWGAFLGTLFSHLVSSIWTNSKHFVFTLGTSSSCAWCLWACVECNPLGWFGERLGRGNETDADRLADMYGHTLGWKNT